MRQLHAISPKPQLVKKLKKRAAEEGISLNALVTPFLNDLATGRLVCVPHYPPQPAGQKAA